MTTKTSCVFTRCRSFYTANDRTGKIIIIIKIKQNDYSRRYRPFRFRRSFAPPSPPTTTVRDTQPMGAPSAPTHSLVAGQVVHQRAAPEVHSGLVIFVRKYMSTSFVLLDDDMNTKIYGRKKITGPAGRTSFVVFLR